MGTHLEFVDENMSDRRYDVFLLLEELETVHQQIVKVQTSKFFQSLFVFLIEL
jgi:hypothetical protein